MDSLRLLFDQADVFVERASISRDAADENRFELVYRLVSTSRSRRKSQRSSMLPIIDN